MAGLPESAGNHVGRQQKAALAAGTAGVAPGVVELVKTLYPARKSSRQITASIWSIPAGSANRAAQQHHSSARIARMACGHVLSEMWPIRQLIPSVCLIGRRPMTASADWLARPSRSRAVPDVHLTPCMASIAIMTFRAKSLGSGDMLRRLARTADRAGPASRRSGNDFCSMIRHYTFAYLRLAMP